MRRSSADRGPDQGPAGPRGSRGTRAGAGTTGLWGQLGSQTAGCLSTSGLSWAQIALNHLIASPAGTRAPRSSPVIHLRATVTLLGLRAARQWCQQAPSRAAEQGPHPGGWSRLGTPHTTRSSHLTIPGTATRPLGHSATPSWSAPQTPVHLLGQEAVAREGGGGRLRPAPPLERAAAAAWLSGAGVSLGAGAPRGSQPPSTLETPRIVLSLQMGRGKGGSVPARSVPNPLPVWDPVSGGEGGK